MMQLTEEGLTMKFEPLKVTDDFIGVHTEDGRAVAMLDSEAAPDFSAEESLAYARLFAAAPALLSALKDLFDDWQTLTSLDYAEGNEDVIRLTDAAAAAMAAAFPSKADQPPATIRCNNCMAQFSGDDELVRMDDEEGDAMDACPNCKTDEHLMDLDSHPTPSA
jgi:hypothetical protein